MPQQKIFPGAASLLAIAAVAVACTSPSSQKGLAESSFRKHVIDSTGQPHELHCKGIADFNEDGKKDVVVCSASGGGIVWYEWPNWRKHTIHSGGGYSTDMQTGDMNGDGRDDIIIPKTPDGNIGNDLFWYEKPSGDATGSWTEHHIGNHGSHDVEKGDFNGDGQLDAVARMGGTGIFLSQSLWTKFPAHRN